MYLWGFKGLREQINFLAHHTPCTKSYSIFKAKHQASVLISCANY